MLIKKENLIIRNATEEDSTILCKWWNDGKVMSHAGFPNGLGTNSKNISESLKRNNDKNRTLIIEFEDKPIGEMSYRTPDNNVAEIGIKICDFDKQNNGLGSKYLRMLIDYLFSSMGYKKIILDTNLKNKRAQHVYEKLGFCKVKTNLDSWKDQMGVWQSSVDYELTEAIYHRNFR